MNSSASEYKSFEKLSKEAGYTGGSQHDLQQSCRGGTASNAFHPSVYCSDDGWTRKP